MATQGAESDSEADRELRRFGKELRAARQAAGLTLAQVAERAGVSHMTVSRTELGQRNPRWSVMHALAHALGRRLGLGVRVGGDDDAQQVLRRFGEELRAARQAAGLSQEQIAAKAGVSQVTVSFAERGEQNLRWSIMYALARALGYRLKPVLGPAACIRKKRRALINF